jgi:hypothetical protein
LPDIEAPSALAPALRAGDVVHFWDQHRPAIADGDYRITVSQTLHDGAESHEFAPERPVYFSVGGPRFALSPSEIHSVFPPSSGSGDFADCLAHVVLTRATLPWERSAERDPDDTTTAPPWLTVLLFEPEELAAVTTSTVPASELLTGVAGATKPLVERSSSDDPDQTVKVIELPWDTLRSLVPESMDHLAAFAHVRTVESGGAADHRDVAVVTGRRVIRPGTRYEAHLVSVEGWFTNGVRWSPRLVGDTVRVVSLHSWRFTSDDGLAFEHEVANITSGRLRLDSSGGGFAGPYLERGFVPLRHEFRNGDRAVSWYRSPLSPVADQAGPTGLPARSADALRFFDGESQMFDVTHGAAWEIGRLLALQNPAAAFGLHAWRRQRSRAARTGTPPVPLGADVLRWFTSDLFQLRALPYRYLVPHDDLLPVESLRRFDVDAVWLRCAADGALSLGRLTNAELQRDHGVFEEVFGSVPALHGFLLRSRVLVDHPGTMIDAFDTSGAPCDPVRLDALAPGLLIALYPVPVRRVSLHLHPQALHFETNHASIVDGFVDVPIGTAVPHSGQLAANLLAPIHQAIFGEDG